MKTLGFIAAFCMTLGLSGNVEAETYTTMNDPSGAPMCFDINGDKAALSACDNDQFELYVTRTDPSGADMCFTFEGAKAPLSKCVLPQAVPAKKKTVSSLALSLFF